MRCIAVSFAIAAGTLLSGCFQADHLAYVYEADVGLDVAYSQEGSGRVVFGYDRNTFALVPQREDSVGPCPEARPAAAGAVAPPAAGTGESMSLTAVSSVEADGLDDVSINHFVATGDAALRVARDRSGLKQIRRAIFPEDSK